MTAKDIGKAWLAESRVDANALPWRLSYTKDLLPKLLEAVCYAHDNAPTDERRLTFAVEQGHFLRRMETLTSIMGAQKVLNDALTEIRNLPDTEPRKTRLEELAHYHLCWGVCYPPHWQV